MTRLLRGGGGEWLGREREEGEGRYPLECESCLLTFTEIEIPKERALRRKKIINIFKTYIYMQFIPSVRQNMRLECALHPRDRGIYVGYGENRGIWGIWGSWDMEGKKMCCLARLFFLSLLALKGNGRVYKMRRLDKYPAACPYVASW